MNKLIRLFDMTEEEKWEYSKSTFKEYFGQEWKELSLNCKILLDTHGPTPYYNICVHSNALGERRSIAEIEIPQDIVYSLMNLPGFKRLIVSQTLARDPKDRFPYVAFFYEKEV